MYHSERGLETERGGSQSSIDHKSTHIKRQHHHLHSKRGRVEAALAIEVGLIDTLRRAEDLFALGVGRERVLAEAARLDHRLAILDEVLDEGLDVLRPQLRKRRKENTRGTGQTGEGQERCEDAQ